MFGDSNGKMVGRDFGPLVVHSPANNCVFRREVTKQHLPERFDSSIVIFGGVFWRAARERLENRRRFKVFRGFESHPLRHTMPVKISLMGHWRDISKRRSALRDNIALNYTTPKLSVFYGLFSSDIALMSRECPIIAHGTL